MAVPAVVSSPPSTSGGASTGRTFVTGLYYGPDYTGNDVTNGLAQGTTHAVPFTVGATTTFDRIGAEVTTLAAGSTIRLGIYTDVGGKPGALVLDAGTIDSSSTGAKEITISQSLTAGRYWLVAVAQGSGTPSIRAKNNNPSGVIGVTSIANENTSEHNGSVAVTGALNASFGAVSGSGGSSTLKIMLRGA